eukprot:COSAG01_NODE_10699_length_2102_cov_1.269096_3_plen_35_part_01
MPHCSVVTLLPLAVAKVEQILGHDDDDDDDDEAPD